MLSASPTVNAKPTPTPAPSPTEQGLQLTEADNAAVAVAQIVSTLRDTFAGLKAMFEKGIPAGRDQQGRETPTISAEAIKKAMGPERVKRIEDAQHALEGAQQSKK